jgi:hypothetical protein
MDHPSRSPACDRLAIRALTADLDDRVATDLMTIPTGESA